MMVISHEPETRITLIIHIGGSMEKKLARASDLPLHSEGLPSSHLRRRLKIFFLRKHYMVFKKGAHKPRW
jgi:hypothetical protein